MGEDMRRVRLPLRALLRLLRERGLVGEVVGEV